MIIYKDFFEDYLSAVLSVQNYTDYISINKCYQDGLASFRALQFEEGLSSFKKGEDLCNAISDNTMLDWVNTIAYPAKAYYFYKTNNYNNAIEYTQKAIFLFECLYDQGHELNVFGVIQQYHNLSRIYFTYKEFEKAVALSIEIFGLLLTGRSPITSARITDNQYKEQKDFLISGYVTQVINEALYSILRLSGPKSSIQKHLSNLLCGLYKSLDANKDSLLYKRCQWLFLFSPIVNKQESFKKIDALDSTIYNNKKKDIIILSKYLTFFTSNKRKYESKIA